MDPHYPPHPRQNLTCTNHATHTISALIFCHQWNNKKEDRLCTKFSSTPNTNVQQWLHLVLQNQHTLCYLFFKDLKPQVKINKIVNKHTHESIHLVFHGLLKRLSLFRIFNFFLEPVYPIMVGKIFKFMVLRLLENAFESKN